ncbi:MAG: type IV secretory system conjugative DNA transfer family protein, partial [Pseudomonadota bacterium]
GALIKHQVEVAGRADLPTLSLMINAIEADPDTWAKILNHMAVSKFDDVRRVAGEMLTKQTDSPREFGSIMGTIYAALGFLDDPHLRDALEDPDVSLADFSDPGQCRKLFLNIPAEYLGQWAPLIRLFFTVAMLYKGRRPSGPQLMLLVDEAGQLGKFDALLRAFTFGRGAGIRAWAVFQDAGQIIRNFGAPALQGFIGSAQLRQFFGVRDYQTAELVSNMLGSETLSYNDPLVQEQARRQKMQAAQKLMSGGDPFENIYEIAHFNEKARHRTKQHRKLMTPDEVLSLRDDQQILFISGKNLKPILANKYPYFRRREMAGSYLPNPYHPPTTTVPIKQWVGSTRMPVIRERVPGKFASFPQYASGWWLYVDGYKPT